MAKEEVKPRGTWKIVELISFLHERTVFLEVWDCKRCLKIQFKTAKGFLELPVELLYPLELHCNNITDDSNKTELWMKKKGLHKWKIQSWRFDVLTQTNRSCYFFNDTDMTKDIDIKN